MTEIRFIIFSFTVCGKQIDKVCVHPECWSQCEFEDCYLMQGCKNMLTFLKPELPNFKSFLVLPGVLNENLADININDIIYCVLKDKCLKHIKEISFFDQSFQN